MRAQQLLSKTLAALCALVAILAVSCVPAEAEVTHKYLSSITEVPAEGPKGEPVALPGPLSQVNSMTVDEGKLFVAEGFGSFFGTSRIDEFDTSTRAFLRQFDQPAAPVYAAQFGIAVGHAAGEPQIYVGAGGETSGVVVPFDAEGHQLGSPWVGEDTPAGSFSGHEEGRLADVAVDNDTTSLLGDWAAGDVFVDTWSEVLHVFTAMNVIDVFKPEAGGKEKYVTQLTGTCVAPGTCAGEAVPFNGPSKVAVDPRNGDLLVVDRDAEGINGVVDLFKPGPLADEYEFVGSVTGSPLGAFHEIEGIAIDGGEGSFAEGAFYVVSRGAVYQFDATGRYVGRFSPGSENVSGIAVDPSTHDVYVGLSDAEEGSVQIFGPSLLLPDVTTAAASSVAPESAMLNGTVNPDNANAGQTTCQFVWGTSESFGHVKPCSAPVAEGESPVAASAAMEGLQPDRTYYYRLQASNANGTNEGEASQTLHFTTPGPGLLEESALGISSTSATLAARIDPHGASTSYYFQYGTTPAYGSDTPAAPGNPLGAGDGSVEVTRRVQGLSSGTAYHYRVVITSDVEVEPGVSHEMTFDGQDQTFTTQQPGGGSLVLPDGREWELVSPVNKHGALIVGQNFAQASKSGDGIVYEAVSPTEAEAPGYAEGEQVLSTHGRAGWSTKDISLPHRVSPGTTLLHGGNYRFFSEDLSLGLAEPTGAFTSLVPEATPPDTERTLYLRHNDTCVTDPSTCYLPLVTGAPGYSDVPPGTVFDPAAHSSQESSLGTVRFVGATGDLEHVLIASRVALTPEPIGSIALYEWFAGKPPSEELKLITAEAPERDDPIPAHGIDAISNDGSRVIFETRDGHLDQRDTTDGELIQLDEVQPGASGRGSSLAVLQAASSDGSTVYFTDWQKLTSDAGAHGNTNASGGKEPDLYECRVLEVGDKRKCSLTDVTPETDSRRANVVGSVLGASEDASDVYFVATGVLSTQPNDGGEHAVAGAPNLYESHSGTVELVTVLSSEDGGDWNGIAGGTARVSPNGRFLAFMSDRSLTGYDNVDVNTGEPDQEVFLFDSATARIACVSCNPSGARPEAVESEEEHENNELGGENTPRQAARIPGWSDYSPGKAALYQTRYLSDSGRLFFDSTDALVPRDVNKQEDVYEYKPTGAGDCQPSSPHYEAGWNGCVGLISSGTAKGESTFIDASENGEDVFFLTNERLVGSDVDTAADIYDAHVCSTAAPCAKVPSASPPCTTADACRTAALPQPGIFGSPATATFVGAGNLASRQAQSATPKSRPLTRAQKLARALRSCRHKTQRRRTACERKTRRQYSSRQARRARVKNGGRG